MDTLKIIPTLTLLAIAVLLNCQNPNEFLEKNDIEGTWQLRLKSGGFAGICDTLDISCENHVMIFDHNYVSFFYNDSLEWEGCYYLMNETPINSSEIKEVIYYDYDRLNDVITYQKNDTLILSENVIDGFIRTYVRIRDSTLLKSF